MKKYGHLIAIFLIITIACLFFASEKDGLHIDEIYSFGLSNSYYAPYLTDIKGGNLVDEVITRQELLDYLTVGSDDAFAFGSVYYNQTRDVHPPLYYWLLNSVSSLFRNLGFSKWPALGLNLLLYLTTLFVLYRLAQELFESTAGSAAVILLYGLSSIGISCFILIRMYSLLSLLSVLLALLVLRLEKSKKKRYYPFICLAVFLGMMTQYYFVFYAFFLCLSYDIYLLIKKDCRHLLRFSVSALLGIGLMVLAFPACIKHIFVGNGQVVSGENTVDNIMNISGWAAKFARYFENAKQLRIFLYALVFLTMFVFCYTTVMRLKGRANKQSHSRTPMVPVIILPAYIAFITVVIVSPVNEMRYIYNITPVMMMLICPVVKRLSGIAEGTGHKALILNLAFAALLLVSLRELSVNSPDYLYKDEKNFSAVTDEYTDIPCVYFDDNYFAPVTADILQLLKYDEFLVFNDPESERFKDYISNSDSYIAYLDNSWYWSGGVYYELVRHALGEASGYRDSELVYEHGLSITYVFRED